jgi:hypothetical protein
MAELIPIEGDKPPIPRTPKGFKAPGRALWRQIHAEYDFEGCPEKLVVLENACRTADVVERLQAAVDSTTDLRVRGSQGQPVAIPELGELRQYRAQLASLLKALDVVDEAEVGTGKMTRSQLGRLGAQARWGGAVR